MKKLFAMSLVLVSVSAFAFPNGKLELTSGDDAQCFTRIEIIQTSIGFKILSPARTIEEFSNLNNGKICQNQSGDGRVFRRKICSSTKYENRKSLEILEKRKCDTDLPLFGCNLNDHKIAVSSDEETVTITYSHKYPSPSESVCVYER